MILFAGIASEGPLALAIDAAERLGVAYAVLHQRDTPHAEIALRADRNGLAGHLTCRSGRLALESVRGVLPRMMDAALLPEVGSDLALASKARAFAAIFAEWLEEAEAIVLNRIVPSAANGSKPYQAAQLAGLGWDVPETLLANDPEAVAEFRARVGRVVYKSLSGVRSIVTELDDAGLRRLARVRALPTQFQQRVEGTDIRVHVVGEAVFATEISTDAIDYRYAKRSGQSAVMTSVALPDAIAEQCVATARVLELPLCGIDLRRRPDGRFTAFEVNPAPAYSWYEDMTGQPIAAAIVTYLAGV